MELGAKVSNLKQPLRVFAFSVITLLQGFILHHFSNFRPRHGSKVYIVRDGLQYKMKWGTKGYSDFVKRVPIYPSVRTLQQHVEHMHFDSGIIEEVFSALECDVPKMKEEERECILVLDEMAIKEGEMYDSSVGRLIGSTSFPPHSGIGKKGLVFMLAGIATRWKFPVAYYFTSSCSKNGAKRKKGEDANAVGATLKQIVLDIIFTAERIKLRVSILVCDMGPDNRAMWLAFGVGVLNGAVICFIEHPVRRREKLWIMPDPIHLFKNILTSFSSNLILILPEEVVIDLIL